MDESLEQTPMSLEKAPLNPSDKFLTSQKILMPNIEPLSDPAITQTTINEGVLSAIQSSSL